MKSSILAAGLAALSMMAGAPAGAQVKIGVVASATGPTAMVGISQIKTVPLLPEKAGGLSIKYIALDDGSDTNKTVTDFKKLITEDHVDAIIGPTGSPNAMSVIGLAAKHSTPMLAPVGAASVVLPMTPVKKWVFKTTQNTSLIAQALIGQMVKSGVKTLGFIGFNDAYGTDWLNVISKMAKSNHIKIVATERYQRSDTSVTGQALKVLAAKPDAVLVAGTGAAAVLPETTLVQQGYKGQFYQTHGAALPAFLKLGGKAVDGTILAASLMLVLPEIPDSNPSKKLAEDYVARYEKKYGKKPATFGANVYDAGLLLQKAIPLAAKKGKPGTEAFRSALRDALEQTRELVGTQGVYNMTPEDHSGFDKRGRELIVVRNGQWHLLGAK
jgi:branched-chain amino acid transport system substrate-binding protein